MLSSDAPRPASCASSRIGNGNDALLGRLGHHTDYIDEHALPDRMVLFAGKLTFLFILCHPHRLKIMRRVFTIFGTVLLMRAVSVTVTVLPDASPICREKFSQPVRSRFANS